MSWLYDNCCISSIRLSSLENRPETYREPVRGIISFSPQISFSSETASRDEMNFFLTCNEFNNRLYNIARFLIYNLYIIKHAITMR